MLHVEATDQSMLEDGAKHFARAEEELHLLGEIFPVSLMFLTLFVDLL